MQIVLLKQTLKYGADHQMTRQKFYTEVETLEKFFTKYCNDKHHKQYEKTYTLEYKGDTVSYSIKLCDECHTLIKYSFNRLLQCPHKIKPRCRKCPNPCYEKKEWKQLAKLMRYSGLQFGLIKIKNSIKKIYNTVKNPKD